MDVLVKNYRERKLTILQWILQPDPKLRQNVTEKLENVGTVTLTPL